jgi:hypothetical protein
VCTRKHARVTVSLAARHGRWPCRPRASAPRMRAKTAQALRSARCTVAAVAPVCATAEAISRQCSSHSRPWHSGCSTAG